MANLAGKLEADVELKSSADKFFKTLSTETHKIPNASDNVSAVELHEGDWLTPGSIKNWTYTIGGKTEVLKEKMELDEANKSVYMEAVGGHCLELYKNYKLCFKTIPKGDKAVAKITIEYEKLNASVPPPNHYLDFLVSFVKDVDAC